MKPQLILALIVATLFPIALQSQDDPPTTPTELSSIEQLVADLEAILEEHDVPGAGIAIVNKDADIWVGGLGLADIETERRANADTQFRIGSITKMFVSLSALKLQEEGLLKLSDPIRKHIDDIPWKNKWAETHPITIAHLLEHSSGFDDLHFNEYALQEPDINLKDAFHYNPRGRYARWRPGNYATYSNANPPLAAYVIEKIKDLRFEDYVAQTFFEPIGMPNSDYFLSPKVEALLATGYQGSKTNPTPVDYWHIIMRPSGSINASAKEMGRFVQFLLNRGTVDGHEILTEQSIQRMETVETTLAAQQGAPFGYGLNNYHKNMQGRTWHGHNGGMMGFVADLSYLPKDGVGFAIMINRSSPALGELGNRIAKFLIADLPEVEPPERFKLSNEELDKYAGTYQKIAVRNQGMFPIERLNVYTLKAEDGILKASTIGDGSFTLTSAGGSNFFIGEQKVAVASFFQNDEGEMCLQQHGMIAYKQTSPLVAWGQVAIGATIFIMGGLSILLLAFAALAFIIRKLKRDQPWGALLLPAFATLSFLGSAILFVVSASNFPNGLGSFTLPGLGSYLLGWLFAILTLISIYRTFQLLRNSNKLHWLKKTYLTLANATLLILLAYIAYWGSWLPIWMS
ncbi:MAG: serine hydrolase domain-containing protein [Verrucomicrobiota bacterium]